MALAYIGPVALGDHGNPDFSWTSAPLVGGFRKARIEGVVGWTQVKQLGELIANADLRLTVGDYAGVLAEVWSDDVLLGGFNGRYLLESFELSGTQSASVTGWVGFSIDATFLGKRQLAVTRSSRLLENDYGLGGQALIAAPFWHEEDAPSPFLVAPSGVTPFTREYDPTFPLERDDLAGPGRNMILYAAPFAAGADPFPIEALLPRLVDAITGPPAWIVDRGGECRAHDRHEERDVFGPGHPLRVTSDLVVTNGLVWLWLGNRGLPAFFTMRAFRSDEWHEVGTIQFGTRRLLGARLEYNTPEAVVVELELENLGNAYVSIKRGERMVRVLSPADVAATWAGTPPTSHLVRATNAPGRFGSGLDAGGDVGTWAAPYGEPWAGDPRFSWGGDRILPDLRPLWPPEVVASTWERTIWLTADKAVEETNGAGFLTLYDRDGIAQARLWLEESDSTVRFSHGASTVISDPVSFDAGDELFFGIGFSSVLGMKLTVGLADGSVSHYTDAAALTPGEELFDAGYFVNFSTWGDGTWGEGSWGGETLFPDGAIDADRIFERMLTNAELEDLAAATTALEGLPVPEAVEAWAASYDVDPIPVFGVPSAGRSTETGIVAADLTRVVASLTPTRSALLLTTTGDRDGALDQHNQAAGENSQEVRVA